ncbi:MAG TPA: hypothetical protein VJT68_05830, partial [Thermoleophilaceae bacterium]|nr:hypothetical protein [Thermoleophilaceae bacterium]
MSVRISLSAAACALVLAALPAAAAADPLTGPVPTWVPDGEVKAMAVSGSTAYIGGNFSRIAPYTGSAARFSESTGELQPWPQVEGVVNAVAPDGAGGWYLGGDFRSVGGVPRTDLAHILPSGLLDPDWAPSTNGLVRALAVGADTVFAGGEFTTVSGTARENLAGLTKATGALTGFAGGVSQSGPSIDPPGVYALLLIGSTLYTGGEFNLATSVIAIAARLRGAAFNTATSQILAWNPNTNRVINGLARDGDGTDIFIGGRFSAVNGSPGAPRNAVAKVDEAAGTADPNWVAPVLGGTDLRTLMVSGSWVYLAGSVNVGPGQTWPVAAYNTANNNAGINNNWHPVPAGGVQSLAASGSTVYIGSGSTSDGLPQPAIMGVNATSFQPSDTPSFAPKLGRGREQLPSGQSIGVRAIGASGSEVVAGGTFTNAGGADRRNLAAIDLTTGRPTAFNPPMRGTFSGFSSVEGLALTSDGLVWAGGDFATEGPDPRAQLAAFDANTGAIASFHRDPSGGVLEGVLDLAAAGSTVYVAGTFSSVGGVPRRNVAAVTNVPGETGTVLPFDVDVNGPVRALAAAGDTVYLGGQFSTVNSGLAALKRDRRNLAAVDGVTGVARDWDPDADNVVRALAVSGDTVFAGGDFGTVNRSVPRGRGAAFDAVTGAARPWDPGADGAVRAFAFHGNTVFAGGDFANVNGGTARPGVAALDRQTGASDPLALELSTEERAGPTSPPVARVGALFASPQTGLVAGGTFVTRSPEPLTENLAVRGLVPLPVDG